MSLWNPNKPLTQPPHYGRVMPRDVLPKHDPARVAHNNTQFDRLTHTKKYGLRAKVV